MYQVEKCVLLLFDQRRHSVTLVFFIYLDRLSDILRITEIVCTLDGRVMNKLRIVYDLVMLSPSGKDI